MYGDAILKTYHLNNDLGVPSNHYVDTSCTKIPKTIPDPD